MWPPRAAARQRRAPTAARRAIAPRGVEPPSGPSTELQEPIRTFACERALLCGIVTDCRMAEKASGNTARHDRVAFSVADSPITMTHSTSDTLSDWLAALEE